MQIENVDVSDKYVGEISTKIASIAERPIRIQNKKSTTSKTALIQIKIKIKIKIKINLLMLMMISILVMMMSLSNNRCVNGIMLMKKNNKH
jgi:hypothetical protein